MTPAVKRFVYATVLAAAATGLVLLWTRYVARPGEESDPPPIDATAQHLHVLVVPVVVFAFGVLWPTHILPHLRTGRRLRATGLVLLPLSLLMVATGYGVQVAIDEVWYVVLGWAHVASGTMWLVTFAIHLLGARRSALDRSEEAGSPSPTASLQSPDRRKSGDARLAPVEITDR